MHAGGMLPRSSPSHALQLGSLCTRELLPLASPQVVCPCRTDRHERLLIAVNRRWVDDEQTVLQAATAAAHAPHDEKHEAHERNATDHWTGTRGEEERKRKRNVSERAADEGQRRADAVPLIELLLVLLPCFFSLCSSRRAG